MGKKIIIVGSGVSAALVTKGLLEKYSSIESITLLEAGNAVEQMNRRKWQDYVTTDTLPYEENRDIPQEYISSPDKIGLEESRLFVRGGSTVHWGGWALRFKTEDFKLFSAAEREIDWPYGYDTLEPYYYMAEHALGIAGDSNVDLPPRNGKKYPYDAPAFTQADGFVIDGLRKNNIDFSHLPIARFGDRCVTTGTCKYCPVGGRFSATMILDELARAYESSSRLNLQLGCSVRSVIMGSSNTALGVEYNEIATGKTKQLLADLVILCAGAIETPKILLSSIHKAWPVGLGNNTGHVGHHFKTHPMLYVDATLSTNNERVHQELDFPTLCSRHFDSEKYQREGKFFFVRAVSSPNVGLEKLMSSGKPISFVDTATRGPMNLSLNGFIEQFSSKENYIELADGLTRFGVRRTKINYTQLQNQARAADTHIEALKKILSSTGATVVKAGIRTPRADHTTSTTRMSISELNGVVDPNLRVHGTDNVYICSNSVFPNVAAVNPTLTLVAIALRFVDTIGNTIRL